MSNDDDRPFDKLFITKLSDSGETDHVELAIRGEEFISETIRKIAFSRPVGIPTHKAKANKQCKSLFGDLKFREVHGSGNYVFTTSKMIKSYCKESIPFLNALGLFTTAMQKLGNE